MRFSLILVSLLFWKINSLAAKPITPTKTVEMPNPANEPIVKVVQKVLPAVVNLNTTKLIVRAFTEPLDEMFNQYFGGPYFGRKIAENIKSLGSGFVVNEEGYILTNEHVVERAADLKFNITTLEGKTYIGKYIYGDENRDLALLKIVAENALEKTNRFSFLSLEELSSNYVGQTAIVLGNPVGYLSSVRTGILNGKDRTVGAVSGLLQIDAAINPGNSGGPIVDIAGKVMGISSFKISSAQNATTENRGFAIPGDVVAAWAKDAIAIAHGEKKPIEPGNPIEVLKQRLGVEVQELTPDLAKTLGFNFVDGVLITKIQEESPAAKGNLAKGLVLQAVGRYPTTSLKTLPQEITQIKPGNPISLLVVKPVKKGSVLIQQKWEVQLVAR